MSSVGNNWVLVFSIGASVFGIFLTTIWAINPPMANDNFPWRKLLIDLLFSLICVLGILAALFSNRCSEAFHFRKSTQIDVSRRILVASHHPECERFSAHIVCINGQIHCAACTGLLFGAAIALVAGALYFFDILQIGDAGFPTVLIGVVGVLAGFLQWMLRGFARLVLNVSFVLGALLCLVGIDQLAQNLALDLFLITLIILWILTRIQLSQWDHSRICNRCDSPCEVDGTKKMQD